MIQVLELNIRKFCFLEFHNAIKAGSPLQCASRVAGIIISQIYSALLNFHLKFGEILQRWSQFRRIYLHQPTLNWVPIKAWAKVKLNFSICTNVNLILWGRRTLAINWKVDSFGNTHQSRIHPKVGVERLFIWGQHHIVGTLRREFSKPLCCSSDPIKAYMDCEIVNLGLCQEQGT